MTHLLVGFFISLIVTLLVIRFDHVHGHFSSDHDLNGVQKFHVHPVPRIGGISLFIAMLAIWVVQLVKQAPSSREFSLLLLSSLPAFLGGLIEDVTKKVGVLHRLVLTMLAAVVGFFLLDAGLHRLDIPYVDSLLVYVPFALLITAVAAGGVANAINIIDGYNGLAGVYAVIVFFALGYVAFICGDLLIWGAALAMVGALLGFLVWNYPRGLIFLGDGGAYFIGFMLAELSILLVNRHPQVSAWFPFLLLIYPVIETVFSIYRRKFLKGGSPGMPDAAHLHQLIYKRLVRWALNSNEAHHKTQRNAMTSPYLWVLSSLAVIPALLFWQHTWVLQLFTLLFVFSYIWLYRSLVLFRAPKWMIIRKIHQSDEE
ncbi:glycosyltransferase [Leeia sp. TBRC 13508]|uniref:Glycosyltransferase n=1 Tax=Leeia speluncae TaxID=2884804 RepID=A0ABS8D3M8_9NEIS|nr:glycosyltransferase [Leeia speluncae]MCB6182785.1 glycosyltransferase [Leeia speluncae]